MDSVTITLIMIVKNESKIIERCLFSVKNYVDFIVISDTGSSDNTVDLIKQFLQKTKIPGDVYTNKWMNFGHNRTLSVLNGRDFLKKMGVNLEKNYFLTIDADMIIHFKPGFDKNSLSQADSWLIEQGNPGISYYNIRFFKSSLPFKSIGVTHEYWGCSLESQKGKMETVVIEDRADGGCKSDKFTRDIALLKQGLKDEPQNVRYLFYLAQSYMDIGDMDNALKYYQKRVNAGGWPEEIYISYIRRGDMYLKMGKFELAINEWLYAYEVLPIRSESLFRIVQEYRLKGRHQMANLYLSHGIQIPYPKDCVLFIEHPIYVFGFQSEMCLLGYMFGRLKEGLLATQYLCLTKTIPSYVKEMTREYLKFYVPQIKSTNHQTLVFPPNEPFINSTPSFVQHETLKGIVRFVNYEIMENFQCTIKDPNHIVRTRNFWIQMNGQSMDIHELKCNFSPKRKCGIVGLEDMRLFYYKGMPYATATSLEYGEYPHPSQVLVQIDENTHEVQSIKHLKYMPHLPQKNWIPFVKNDTIYVIYSHSPLIILEIDPDMIQNKDLKVVINKTPAFDLSEFRGSSNPVWIGTDCLLLVHEVFGNPRNYCHRFLKYDSEWNVKSISEPFYFGKLFVEFCTSIVYLENTKTVRIFYSTTDHSTESIDVNESDIQWLNDDISKI